MSDEARTRALGSSAAAYAIWGASLGELVLIALINLLVGRLAGGGAPEIAVAIGGLIVFADMVYAASLPAIVEADAAGLTVRGPLWRRHRIAWSDVLEIRRGRPPSRLMGPGGSRSFRSRSMTRGDVPDTPKSDSPFVILVTRTAGWPNLRARLVIACASPQQADEAAAIVRTALAGGRHGPYREATDQGDGGRA